MHSPRNPPDVPKKEVPLNLIWMGAMHFGPSKPKGMIRSTIWLKAQCAMWDMDFATIHPMLCVPFFLFFCFFLLLFFFLFAYFFFSGGVPGLSLKRWSCHGKPLGSSLTALVRSDLTGRQGWSWERGGRCIQAWSQAMGRGDWATPAFFGLSF